MADQTPTPDPQPDANEGLIANVVHAVEDALHSDPALAPHDSSGNGASPANPASTEGAPATPVPAAASADAPTHEAVSEQQPATPVAPEPYSPPKTDDQQIDYREPENVLARGNVVSDGPGTVGS